MTELKTLRNGLALLRLLEGRPATGITDLARELGISPSAAHRIAGTLRSEGFLQQEPRSRRYALGDGIVLGRAGSELERCLAAAPEHLAALRDVTDETVHIGLLRGAQASFPLAVESTRQVRVSSNAGRTVPAHATAVGKILLSYSSDGEIRRRLGERLEPLTDSTLRTADAFLREMAAVRKQGYALNVSEMDADMYTVAVAVEGSGGEPLCALAVSAPLTRVRSDPATRNPAVEDPFLTALRRTAAALSAAAGGRRG